MKKNTAIVYYDEFFNYALKKNKQLHKEFSRKYVYLGSGKFIKSYYDETTNSVLKVFRLDVLLHDTHSQTIHSNATGFFSDVIFPVVENAKKTIQALRKYIWKGSLDCAEFCFKHCQDNEHLPYVHSIEYDNEHFAYIIKTEYLVHANRLGMNNIYKFMKNLTDCIHYHKESNIPFNIYYTPHHFEMNSNQFKEYIELVNYHKMKRLSAQIKRSFKNYEIDLHSRNYMFRNNEKPIIVINDPLY